MPFNKSISLDIFESFKDRFGNNYTNARIGVIGSQNPDHIELKKYGLFASIYRGIKETYDLSATSFLLHADYLFF